ncbi:hypothetical protein HON86_01080 [Candidatus Woesearchaeota archaeon]|jgi:hypothetical protein|nr:hypothetical protein [Candidatus Woesearchaeota archaeon]MBT4835193.1 hypothetical protein [Candidatus Woesearchaeota archaeon]MBT6735378.1 hypothetical protein [Candidatus Woesearchaeota archaeon]MBT7169899.1 hypothetical protein [Candidatus Woesearchaeota archaeon]MBT7474782.1 hypothetical protein [Candidatus Woesearchaeota archaeon]
MKKKLSIIVLVLFLGIGFASFSLEDDSREINAGQRITGNVVQKNLAVNIDYSNLASFLSRNAAIKDIPANTKILLRFYNFNTGSRNYEKTFVLESGHVSEGTTDNPDLYIDVHSKYLNDWNSGNFCQIMTRAKNNGDMGITSDLPVTKLLWKFRAMSDHKSCFGL